ncbi:MAG TPA: hypothetical protein VHW60_17695 [Caulobacteraceae bacterium]|jgi:hypothetical protein|nr:hypothetical protein [Caulobacteraceae bacterium]
MRAGVNNDPVLIALGRYRRTVAQAQAAGYYDTADGGKELRRFRRALLEADERVARTTATTLAGLREQARYLAEIYEHDTEDWELRLIRSVCAGIEAMVANTDAGLTGSRATTGSRPKDEPAPRSSAA